MNRYTYSICSSGCTHIYAGLLRRAISPRLSLSPIDRLSENPYILHGPQHGASYPSHHRNIQSRVSFFTPPNSVSSDPKKTKIF